MIFLLDLKVSCLYMIFYSLSIQLDLHLGLTLPFFLTFLKITLRTFPDRTFERSSFDFLRLYSRSSLSFDRNWWVDFTTSFSLLLLNLLLFFLFPLLLFLILFELADHLFDTLDMINISSIHPVSFLYSLPFKLYFIKYIFGWHFSTKDTHHFTPFLFLLLLIWIHYCWWQYSKHLLISKMNIFIWLYFTWIEQSWTLF